MSLANVSTPRLVLDAQRLDTRTTRALRNINILAVEKNKKCSYYKSIKDCIFFRSSYNL